MGGCGPHGGVPGIVGWAEGVSPVSGSADQAASEGVGVGGVPGVAAVEGAMTSGQVAYEAYRDAVGGNRPWSEVREPEREVWKATEQAVIGMHLAKYPTP